MEDTLKSNDVFDRDFYGSDVDTISPPGSEDEWSIQEPTMEGQEVPIKPIESSQRPKSTGLEVSKTNNCGTTMKVAAKVTAEHQDRVSEVKSRKRSVTTEEGEELDQEVGESSGKRVKTQDQKNNHD